MSSNGLSGTQSPQKKEPINKLALDNCIVRGIDSCKFETPVKIRLFSECLASLSLQNDWIIGKKIVANCESKLQQLLDLFQSMSNPKLFGSKTSEQRVGTMFDIIWHLFIQIMSVTENGKFTAKPSGKTVNHTQYGKSGKDSKFGRCKDIEALVNGRTVKNVYWGENPTSFFIGVISCIITECKNAGENKKGDQINKPEHPGFIFYYVLPIALKKLQGGEKHGALCFDLNVFSELVSVEAKCDRRENPTADYYSKIKDGEIVRTTMFKPMKEDTKDMQAFPGLLESDSPVEELTNAFEQLKVEPKMNYANVAETVKEEEDDLFIIKDKTTTVVEKDEDSQTLEDMLNATQSTFKPRKVTGNSKLDNFFKRKYENKKKKKQYNQTQKQQPIKREKLNLVQL